MFCPSLGMANINFGPIEYLSPFTKKLLQLLLIFFVEVPIPIKIELLLIRCLDLYLVV